MDHHRRGRLLSLRLGFSWRRSQTVFAPEAMALMMVHVPAAFMGSRGSSLLVCDQGECCQIENHAEGQRFRIHISLDQIADALLAAINGV